MSLEALAPLRHRSFALAWSSSLVSSLGTWMQSVALGIFLYERTHEAFWLGATTMAGWLPAIVGSPVGGVVADRWSRQRWIQINNLVMGLCATALAVLYWLHALTPSLVVTLAAAEGLSSSSSWAAWQSLLPDLVESHEVLPAVSISSAQFNLGRVVGPALAGVAIALGSIAWCFAINAATFVLVIVAFSFVRSRPRPPVERPLRPLADVAQGARAAWANPACRYAIVAVALVGLTVSPFISLVPAVAIGVFHSRAAVWGLVTAQGLGAVAGALTLPSAARVTSRLVVLRASLVTVVVALAAYSEAPTPLVAEALFLLIGFAYIGVLTGLNTSVQLHAPRAERSRVLALYTLSLSIGYPVGALVQSLLADEVGVRAVTLGAAAIAAAGLGAVMALRPHVLRAIGRAPQPA